MHPIFANMQNAFNNMTPEETSEPKPQPHPFQSLADSFADPEQQGLGKGSEGPQQSQTVTSFSAHMKPWGNEGIKPRRGKR